jgi:hypothetical protein
MQERELEFWPDYGGAVLWNPEGKAVALDTLPLADDLRTRLEAWVGRYDDALLPIQGDGDRAWLCEGDRLLDEVRRELSPRYDVLVTEPWWEGKVVR